VIREYWLKGLACLGLAAEIESAGPFRLLAGAAILVAGLALENFFGSGLYVPIFVFAYLLLGLEVVWRGLKGIGRGLDENFLMTAATLGAFALGEYAEAVGVMLFYQVGEYFQNLAVGKSKKSIARLMDLRPDFAVLKQDGRLVKVAPETVGVGEVIVVGPGDKIPLDGVVIEGRASLDMAALTGEPIPRLVSATDTVWSGCLNQDGVLAIEVRQVYGESTVAKILDLVENAAGRKAPTENFITKFARVYTPVVVGLAVLIALLPPLMFGGPWAEWLGRSLIFLVISCPCALVVSVPLSFFGGLGGASRKGILIKGGNYLEALDHLDTVVFDKTGTLTKGVFKVTAVRPAEGFSSGELMAAAARAEAFSGHPIARSVISEYGREMDTDQLTEFQQTAGRGVSVKAAGRTILAGNREFMAEMGVAFEESPGIGTMVYVAEGGVFMGSLVISDEIKPDSRRTVAALKARGVKVVMLTGDDQRAAEAVAEELELDEVYGGLLPQQKVEKLEMLGSRKRSRGQLAFVGDGLNDAPVLARADVGVAMGALGSDAAIEAADVVLMTDEPSKLVAAMEVARFTRRVAWQNVVFAVGVKVLFLLLGALGVAGLWEAVFADVGVALLAVFNAMRVMRA
jgi:Cd2+/Zn2+-exporting ATPase